MHTFRYLIVSLGLLYPLTSFASFIEATIGTAVVNDATAALYNPAALVAIKRPQIIGLDSLPNFKTKFTGTVTQTATGFTQTGSATNNSSYELPSLYVGIPVTSKLTAGAAVVVNDFNNNIDDHSILRYAQASNSVQNIDFIPALGFRINEFVSVGAGINFTYAKFTQQPLFGFPSLNIPDSSSRNQADGSGIGGDVGVLWRPNDTNVVGFNYRSAITYNLSGTSRYNGTPPLATNNYNYTIWTPARSVISANHRITKQWGLVGTAQYIQWNVFNHVNINNIATPAGIQSAVAQYHMRNSWVLTFGTNYRFNPKWILRAAASYMQSPANNHYQISDGDSYILGASTGYAFNDYIILDASYAHAFINNALINIANSRNIIQGTNSANRDSFSLKVTVNV